MHEQKLFMPPEKMLIDILGKNVLHKIQKIYGNQIQDRRDNRLNRVYLVFVHKFFFYSKYILSTKQSHRYQGFC